MFRFLQVLTRDFHEWEYRHYICLAPDFRVTIDSPTIRECKGYHTFTDYIGFDDYWSQENLIKIVAFFGGRLENV